MIVPIGLMQRNRGQPASHCFEPFTHMISFVVTVIAVRDSLSVIASRLKALPSLYYEAWSSLEKPFKTSAFNAIWMS